MACLVEFVCLPALRVVRSSFCNVPTNMVITLANPSDVNANRRDFDNLPSERYTSVKLFSTAIFHGLSG